MTVRCSMGRWNSLRRNGNVNGWTLLFLCNARGSKLRDGNVRGLNLVLVDNVNGRNLALDGNAHDLFLDGNAYGWK